MIRKFGVVSLLVFLLLLQLPAAQLSEARIYFVDIGQGAGTLIVSPTGRTLLVDGGPGGGGTKIATLLTALGITTIDFTVVTHYHIDHVSGITELLTAGRVAGIAFDNGDGPDVVPPGTLTSPSSTRGTYLSYVAATNRAGVTRQTIVPGRVIDLGGGMQVTCLAAGGRLLSGGSVPITNEDLNAASVSLLVEFNDFDFIVSGDITGGGSTSTAKTPDVETYVGQMAGDVDVVQLSHHGSTTTNNQSFLSAVQAEVAVAQASADNSFGHPNRESVNKYLNTPTSSGRVFSGTGVPPPGLGPVYYQTEAPVPGDDRVTLQGYTGAAGGHAGSGTLLLRTDGSTTYSVGSLEDGFMRISPAVHAYPVDGASPGLSSHFPPTIVARTLPVAPLGVERVETSALVNDRDAPIASVTLRYALNGVSQPPVVMTAAAGAHVAPIPPQPDGTRVDYSITAVAGGRSTTYASGYFSGTTPISVLRALNVKGEPLYAGYAARIRATVTAATYTAGTNDDYVADATGAINVYKSTATPTVFTPTAPGQMIDAVGRIAFNGGRIRLDLTESVEKATSPYGITIVSTGAAPAPQPVTIAQLNASLESLEGRLVRIANASITVGSMPATPLAFDAFVTVFDGTGVIELKIDRDTDLEGFTPASTFTLVGVVQQDDYLRPFDSGYNVAPRNRMDVGAPAPTPPALLTVAEARADRLNNVAGTPGADFVPDRIDQTVRVRGVVTSIDFRGGNGIEYYMQDATGGLDLFSSAGNFGPFGIGETVEATGVITQFNGLTELVVASVGSLGPGTPVQPELVTLAQLADGGPGEVLEGRLVRVDNVSVVSGTIPLSGASANLTIADATAAAQIRIDSDTDVAGTATPAGTFSVVGVVGQSDPTAPFDSRYQIFPRSVADIPAVAPARRAP